MANKTFWLPSFERKIFEDYKLLCFARVFIQAPTKTGATISFAKETVWYENSKNVLSFKTFHKTETSMSKRYQVQWEKFSIIYLSQPHEFSLQIIRKISLKNMFFCKMFSMIGSNYRSSLLYCHSMVSNQYERKLKKKIVLFHIYMN